ncbi:AAA family ATPase [Bradyrhizobium sp. DASA03007]|uniref:AAA family ATPase n=1 Tax=unclassified Bradyrhizobium TaxID=2631580 RepID=UPI003F6E4E12
MRMSQVKRAVRRAVDPADDLQPDPADDHTAQEAELTSSAHTTGDDVEDPRVLSHHDRSYSPVTPKTWKGTLPSLQQWLAEGRVPDNDVTILSGDGGSGKTEIAMQLLICVAGGVGEWMPTPSQFWQTPRSRSGLFGSPQQTGQGSPSSVPAFTISIWPLQTMHTHLPLQTGHKVFPPGIPSPIVAINPAPIYTGRTAGRRARLALSPAKRPPPSAACWYLRWYVTELFHKLPF